MGLVTGIGTAGVAVVVPEVTAFQSGRGTDAQATSRAQAPSIASASVALPAAVLRPPNQRVDASVLNVVLVIFMIIFIFAPTIDSVVALATFAAMLPVRSTAGLAEHEEIFTKMSLNLLWSAVLGK